MTYEHDELTRRRIATQPELHFHVVFSGAPKADGRYGWSISLEGRDADGMYEHPELLEAAVRAFLKGLKSGARPR